MSVFERYYIESTKAKFQNFNLNNLDSDKLIEIAKIFGPEIYQPEKINLNLAFVDEVNELKKHSVFAIYNNSEKFLITFDELINELVVEKIKTFNKVFFTYLVIERLNKEDEFKEITTKNFFDGYDSSDSIYDAL